MAGSNRRSKALLAVATVALQILTAPAMPKDGDKEVTLAEPEQPASEAQPPPSAGNHNITIWEAALAGSLKTVKKLLDSSSNGSINDVNRGFVEGNTAAHAAASQDHVEVLRHLVQEAGADAEAPSDVGRTPLQVAAAMGRVNAVQYLLGEAKVEVEGVDQHGYSALMMAVVNGHDDVVRLLLKPGGADPDAMSAAFGYAALHQAASQGRAAVAETLVRGGADVDLKSLATDVTPLFLAVQFGYRNVTEVLVEEGGADVDVKNGKVGNTALHKAVQDGNDEIAEYLLDQGADATVESNEGFTALFYAVKYDQIPMVKLLLEKGQMDVDRIEAGSKWSALHTATYFAHIDMIDYLVQQGNASTEVVSKDGFSPLFLAAQIGKLDSIKALIEVGNAWVDQPNGATNSTALARASVDGKSDIVKYLVTEANATVDIKDSNGITPLYLAVQHNHLDIVRILVESGRADVDLKNGKKGSTALQRASQDGNVEAIEYLVSDGKAQVDLTSTREGFTALFFAIRHDSLEAVKALVEVGRADVNHVGGDKNWSSLHVSCFFGNIAITKYLVTSANASVDVLSVDGFTPLYTAVQFDKLGCAKALIVDGGADPNFLNGESGSTVLQKASEAGNLRMVEYLVGGGGAAVDQESKEGVTALFLASQNDQLDVVKALINKGKADVNKPNGLGNWTALHKASQEGNLDVVKFLVEEANGNIDQETEEGLTPLDVALQFANEDGFAVAKYLVQKSEDKQVVLGQALIKAARNGNLDAVRYLVENESANIEFVDEKFQTRPLFEAVSEDNQEVVKFLIEAGADVNALNTDSGVSALHRATVDDDPDMTKILVEEGNATVDLLNEMNVTSLYLSVALGKPKAMEYLVLDAKADVDRLNGDEGRAVLHSAAELNLPEVATFLLERGNASAEVRSGDGYLPLFIAAVLGHLDVMRALVGGGADADGLSQGDLGRTALHGAALKGRLDSVEFLVNEANATVDFKSGDGFTPIYMAVQTGHGGIVKALLDGNAEPDILNGELGRSALHKASEDGQVDLIALLVHSQQVDVDLLSGDNLTALYLAMDNGHLNATQVLLGEGGADVAATNGPAQWQVLHLAAHLGRLDLVRLLVEEGEADAAAEDADGRTPLDVAEGQEEVNQDVVAYLKKIVDKSKES